MTTTITQVITTLPTAPDPLSMTPSVFSTTAAASVLAQKAMVPEINTMTGQMNTVAGEVNTNATNAAANATTASAAAATAVATAGVVLWVSGSTYATGVNVYSPVNFLTYRRTSTSPGSTAVDPSADPTKWVCLVGGNPVWIRKTSAYTALSGDHIKASTTAGAWSLTFPAAPSDGDQIEVQDVDGTFQTNNLTLLVNGKKINGYTTSFVLDGQYDRFVFVYDSTLGDWRI